MEMTEYRLGDETVQLTRLNTNTQKVEGTNRASKRSLPKDKTFSRNFQSHAHSAHTLSIMDPEIPCANFVLLPDVQFLQEVVLTVSSSRSKLTLKRNKHAKSPLNSN